MFRLALLPVLLLVPSLAYGHPDKPEQDSVEIITAEETDELSDKIDEKLSKHKLSIARSAARLKRNLEKDTKSADSDMSEELEAVADMLEEAFSKDGLFRDLTAMLGDFAEDIDVESHDGKTVLKFDGAKVGQIETHKSRDSEDRLSISGLGKNLTLDRETIVKDGKSKTRIVIEMDGEDEVEIVLPKTD